ncbi:MAG: glutamate--tRNA ligase [Candidatus Omnitrophica bacterium]|jgi:glutamyl-tRNA synthetase|nr:glutamate--tRNA ligase [Candidatus Omnitrophota bacterium]
MSSSEIIRARFAPSPTGYLHIGGARTCLFSWLFTRKEGGKFILRIEDTDLERSKKEYLEEILESIKWLGLDWDEIYYQSERFDLYREYAQKLIAENKAYQKDNAVFFKYNFESIEIDDLIRGKIVFTELPKSEEVLIKSDGSPTYNFSCVIDDSLMGINYVIRGEDHISNTPKQILMYEALGFKRPKFAHVPLILSPKGGRLSKRFGATSIREYKELGYLPEALVNYLLLLGWSPGKNKEIVSLKEAKDIFDIREVNKTGAVFSLEKLNWVNTEYIRGKSLEEFTRIFKDYLAKDNPLVGNLEDDYLQKIAGLFKNRISNFSDLISWTQFCFHDNINYNEEAKVILQRNLAKEISSLNEKLSELKSFDKETIEKNFRLVADNLGLKARDLVHPVRIALTGEKIGPGLFEVMEVLGKERVLKRLNNLIKFWIGGDK